MDLDCKASAHLRPSASVPHGSLVVASDILELIRFHFSVSPSTSSEYHRRSFLSEVSLSVHSDGRQYRAHPADRRFELRRTDALGTLRDALLVSVGFGIPQIRQPCPADICYRPMSTMKQFSNLFLSGSMKLQ